MRRLPDGLVGAGGGHAVGRRPALEQQLRALHLPGAPPRMPIGPSVSRPRSSQLSVAPPVHKRRRLATVGFERAYNVFKQQYDAAIKDMINLKMLSETGTFAAEDAALLPPSMWTDKWIPPVRCCPDPDAWPIGISVFLHQRADTDPLSENCPEFARTHQYDFYIHGGPDALLQGGLFLDLFGGVTAEALPIQIEPDKDRAGKGHIKAHKWPPWEPHLGWKFPAVFLGAATACEHSMVVPNWRIAALWNVATRAANEELAKARLDLTPGQCGYRNSGVIGWDLPIGWDFPNRIPDWMKKLFPTQTVWSSHHFPQMTRNCTLKFYRGDTTTTEIDEKLRHLTTTDPCMWSKIHPACVYSGDTLVKYLNAATDRAYTVLVGNNHARILVRDSTKRQIRVYDPWRDTFDLPEWMENSPEIDWEVQFIPRRFRDQENEGSCGLHAVARVMLAAIHPGGEGTIMMKWCHMTPGYLAVPVAVQLLFQSRASRETHDPTFCAERCKAEMMRAEKELWTLYWNDTQTMRNLRDASFMFDNNGEFDGDLSRWEPSMLENAECMFRNCSSFTGRGLKEWAKHVTNISNAEAMFEGCTSLNFENLRGWQLTRPGININHMFHFVPIKMADAEVLKSMRVALWSTEEESDPDWANDRATEIFGGLTQDESRSEEINRMLEGVINTWKAQSP